VTLQIKVGWKKGKTRQFGSANGFGPAFFAQFAEVVKKHNKA
jgi:hypothetical protein